MSFDIIGDIAILDETGTQKQALALLKEHSNLKAILKRAGVHKGKYRTRKLSWLAGEKRKITRYKESGCLFDLNVEKCYFSPRLSNERLRITKQVKKNETILVLFSGVAPYPCVIAKNKPVKEIHAIEINPVAHKYAQSNVQLNKLNNIILYKGDVKKVLPKIKQKFDRIIMVLPKENHKYLDLLAKNLKKGGIIHMQSILKEEGLRKQAKDLLSEYLKKFKIKKIVKCGAYSPYVYRVCIDFTL